jgi:tetratricopeptide (TPR) repeat protein
MWPLTVVAAAGLSRDVCSQIKICMELVMTKSRIMAAVLALLFAASLCQAQSAVLNIPRQSQHAVITQRIGITDITVNYHRPLVNGRKIWGGLVPYNEVWRAGANENTTIAFSDPVTIEGQPLDKGIYGLHMIPGENEWTVIFSHTATSWGSFTYKQAEDALRITVKPQPSDMHNALTYDFDKLTPTSAVVELEWEKIAVPFKVDVDVNKIVEASLHRQLRGLAQYTWEGWDDAANYLLAQKTDLDEALKYEDQSIQVEKRYDNELSKANILEAMGRKDEAESTRKLALSLASPLQLHYYARQLQAQKHPEEAFAIFRENARKHPEEWYVHTGMARIYSSQGKFDDAVKEMNLALAGAPDGQKSYVESLVKRLQAKQNIN